MTRSTKKTQTTAGLVTTVLALSACGGVEDTGSDIQENLTVEDVEGRTLVPEIEIVTKTQSEDPTRYELTQMIVDAWNEAGVDSKILPVGTTQMNSMTATSKDFDAYIIGYAGTPERLDPDNFLNRFHSSNAHDSGSNFSMYENEEYDEVYQRTVVPASQEDRTEAVFEAQRILFGDAAAAPIVHPVTGSAYRSDQWGGLDIAPATPMYSKYNAVSADPKTDRDELVIGTTSDATTLNPVMASNNQDLRALQMVYDTVLGFNPEGDLVENAAAEWSSDDQTVQFALQDNLAFTDGTQVTGEDVAFTIDYMQEQGAPLFGSRLSSVENVETSGQEVTITFSEPAITFPTVVLAEMPILPQHVWTEFEDASEATLADLIGSGPFTMTDRSIGDQINFEANLDHYNPPTVERMRLQILGSFDAMAGALESGQIDMINPAESVASQYDQLDGAEGVEISFREIHGWTGLHFNGSAVPFNDKAFRQAVTALIPVDDIIEIVYQGDAVPGGSVIAPTLTRWHNDQLEPNSYDVDAAMGALEEAGYAFGPDGQLYYPEDWSDDEESAE